MTSSESLGPSKSLSKMHHSIKCLQALRRACTEHIGDMQVEIPADDAHRGLLLALV